MGMEIQEYYENSRLASKTSNDDEWQNVFQPVTNTPRYQENRGRPSLSPKVEVRKPPITIDDLERSLFLKNDVRLINIHMPTATKQRQFFWCDACACPKNPGFQCPQHKNKTFTTKQTLPLALRSLPPEVGLCMSSIPGTGCGICARKRIPVGAWIGPYEGKAIKPEDLTISMDTAYMWEIYKDGKLSGFIDGKDLNATSWMRFIRCARHKAEQNLFAFQYFGKVFYRAFKEILPGKEMLVWYDEKYPQYLGIPAFIFDMGDTMPQGAYAPPRVIAVSPQQKQKGKKNHLLDTSIMETVFPSPPPSPLSNPTRSIQHTPFSFDEISHLSHKRKSDDHTNEVAVKKYAPTQSRDIPLPQNKGNLARHDLKTGTRVVHIPPQRQRKLTTNSSSWIHNPNSLGTIVSSQDSQKLNHFGDLLRGDTQLHSQDLKTRQLFPFWRGDATHKYISGASSEKSV